MRNMASTTRVVPSSAFTSPVYPKIPVAQLLKNYRRFRLIGDFVGVENKEIVSSTRLRANTMQTHVRHR